MSFDSERLDRLDALLRAGPSDDRWIGWSWTPTEPDRVDIWRGGRIELLLLTPGEGGYALCEPEGREWWRGENFSDMAEAARRILLPD